MIRKNYNQDGFSLTELIFSILVLALAMIFIIGVFTKMLSATSKGQDMTVATYLAQSELDRMLNDPARLRDIANNTTANIYTGGSNLAYNATFTDSLNKTTYFFQITAQPLIAAATEQQLYFVDVNVYWWGNNPEGIREGIGRTNLRLSRLYYLRN